jgi:predicted NUDIX family phosphoesterase
MSEIIMAVPAGLFKDIPRDHLVQDPDIVNLVMERIESRQMFFPKNDLEDPVHKDRVNRDFRQPIPYVLIEKHETLGGDYVLMQRGKGQGEQRLWGKYCLGAGGHVKQGETIGECAKREVMEELGLDITNIFLQGVMISTGGPVEDVHIGLLYKATVHFKEFTSEELADQNPQWVNWRDLDQYYDKMEKWSQIVMRGFFSYVTKEALAQ